MTDLRDPAELEEQLETHRAELRGYCYRMLGSAFDADDAVQDTMVRAWRHAGQFEGRSALRSWLYRIATNVCLDTIARRQRRALPADLSRAGRPGDDIGPPLIEQTWVEPVADAWITPPGVDPAEQAALAESVRLAFIAVLQVLPARQRAALILRDVLAWRPAEIAGLLDTTVPSVNSALQRARATMAAGVPAVDGSVSAALLDRYVAAFTSRDLDGLVALLHEDATWTMPPYDLWFRGRSDIRVWLERKPCEVSRLVPLGVNGGPGYIIYRPAPVAGTHEAFGVMALDVCDGVITGVHSFLDDRLVALFGGSSILLD